MQQIIYLLSSSLLFQIDLEPNGKLHVIIELDGSASDGKYIVYSLAYFALQLQSFGKWNQNIASHLA